MDFLADVLSWFTTADNWLGQNGVPTRLREHVELSAVPLVIACALALPVGIVLGHRRRGGFTAIALANTWRAVPSYALLLLAYKAFGLGDRPITITLVALAIPPILLNAYVGVSGVDADVRESARGMGMTGWQSLRQVELPLALPLIMAGIRTGAVQVVATATLAAFVAGGGLGRYIVDGRAVGDNVVVFAGAAVVAVLSVATELGLAAVERRVAVHQRSASRQTQMSLTKGTLA